jgi:hypothetical protein
MPRPRLLGQYSKHVALHRPVEQSLRRGASHRPARKKGSRRRPLHGEMIGMVIPTVRIEREEDLWRHVLDDPPNGSLDLEHVHVRQGARILVPLTVSAGGVVKAEEHGRRDAEAIAGQPQLFDAQGAEVGHRSDGRMRLAGFAVRGTRERHAHALFTEVRQHAAMKDLVVGMREDDE